MSAQIRSTTGESGARKVADTHRAWENDSAANSSDPGTLAGARGLAEPAERSDVDILPPPSPALTIPRADDPAALVDGCPECVRNAEPPRVYVRVQNAWRCAYLCTDCGHAWLTDWSL